MLDPSVAATVATALSLALTLFVAGGRADPRPAFSARRAPRERNPRRAAQRRLFDGDASSGSTGLRTNIGANPRGNAARG